MHEKNRCRVSPFSHNGMTQLKELFLPKSCMAGPGSFEFQKARPSVGRGESVPARLLRDPVLVPNDPEVGCPSNGAWCEMETVLRVGYPGFLVSVVQQSMIYIRICRLSSSICTSGEATSVKITSARICPRR